MFSFSHPGTSRRWGSPRHTIVTPDPDPAAWPSSTAPHRERSEETWARERGVKARPDGGRVAGVGQTERAAGGVRRVWGVPGGPSTQVGWCPVGRGRQGAGRQDGLGRPEWVRRAEGRRFGGRGVGPEGVVPLPVTVHTSPCLGTPSTHPYRSGLVSGSFRRDMENWGRTRVRVRRGCTDGQGRLSRGRGPWPGVPTSGRPVRSGVETGGSDTGGN